MSPHAAIYESLYCYICVLSGDARTSDLAFLTMRMQEALAGIQPKLLLVSAAAA
jgi:hypothetical protein